MALRIGLLRSSALQNDGLDAPVILQCLTPQEANPKVHWGPNNFLRKSPLNCDVDLLAGSAEPKDPNGELLATCAWALADFYYVLDSVGQHLDDAQIDQCQRILQHIPYSESNWFLYMQFTPPAPTPTPNTSNKWLRNPNQSSKCLNTHCKILGLAQQCVGSVDWDGWGGSGRGRFLAWFKIQNLECGC
jgi:hypothetical protein